MALSGSFSGGIKGYTVRTDWTATQNINDNYSDITCELYLICGSNYNLSIRSKTHSISIDGQSYPINSSLYTRGGETLYLGQVTKRVYHYSDGSRSVYLTSSVTFNAHIHGRYIGAVYGGSDTITLDKIPRMSVITDVMDGSRELGQQHTIHINKFLSGNITHTVWYIIYGEDESKTSGWHYIADKTSDLDITFTSVTDHIELQPNSSIIYMDFGIDTYKDGVKFGETTYSKHWFMEVPKNVKPTITDVEIVETNEKAKALGVYVQNHSKLNVKTSALGIYGSTIKSVKVEVAEQTLWGANATSSEITASGNVDVTVTVTDSRDRTDSSTKTVKVEPYFLPSIVKFSGHRLEQDEKTVTILRNFKMASIDDKNSCTWKTEKRLIGSSTWNIIREGTDKTLNSNALVYDINSSFDYEFRLTISDFYTSSTQSFYINSGFRLINFHPSGTGFGIGQVSKRPNIIDVNIPTVFKKLVYIEKLETNQWQEVKYYNTTRPYDSDSKLMYRKNIDNTVTLKGVVTGAGTTGYVGQIVDRECRPKRDILKGIICTDYNTASIRIKKGSGDIFIDNRAKIDTTWISFDDFTFPLD